MPSKKLTDLQTLVIPEGEDLLYVVDDPNGTPTPKRVDLATLFGNIPTDVKVKGTATVEGETVFESPVSIASDASVEGTLTVQRLLASVPVRTISEEIELPQTDIGGVVTVTSGNNLTVTLPNNWTPGQTVVLRRGGTGEVFWAFAENATALLPTSRETHVRIAEQHSEIAVRVLENSDGVSAVYSIEGATSE